MTDDVQARADEVGRLAIRRFLDGLRENRQRRLQAPDASHEAANPAPEVPERPPWFGAAWREALRGGEAKPRTGPTMPDQGLVSGAEPVSEKGPG